MRLAQTRLPVSTVSLILISLLACYAPTPSVAQSPSISSDADFSSLVRTGKRSEIEALAREKLAKNARDDVALWYLARVASGDAQKREEVIKRAEQCIAERPQSARCHNALGGAYGALAMAGGMTAGLKYVGKIKDAMLRAVELEPNNFDLRRDLIQFYLQAPGIAGGSVRKATQNAEEFQKIDGARGALLRAEVHAYEKEFDRAEGLLASVKAGSGTELDDSVFSAQASLGFAMLNASEAARAQRLFERLVASRPGSATALFGLGRAQLEQKQIDASIVTMEKALSLDPKLSAHYRLGLAYQSKGNKAKAITAFEQFLTYQAQGKAAEDARKRLDELKRN